METSKLGSLSVPEHSGSVAAQTHNKMDIQAPLTAVYIQAMPALGPQPQPQEPAALHLPVPPLYSKETLPFLTLTIAGRIATQHQGLAATPPARPRAAGKHMCPHCGRDCMKPSVLEKHLRCHTGERPYPCTTCGISFKTQSNLYKHRRTQAHARLSSESEQGSLGSQDSLHSSRDTCTSSFSLDSHCEDPGNLEKDAAQPPVELSVQGSTETQQGADSGWMHTVDAVKDQKALSSLVQNMKPAESLETMREEEKPATETKRLPAPPNRHLQRQEATLFSKQWETSVSQGKTQSHDSTDSGFSESSEQYPSPGSVLPEHSMESLTESSLELLEHPGQPEQEPKAAVSKREQRTLEERISKLISENSAVVEDKHLENMRPRKTVLSKQGSIDLPMPYTYKDSFHFDMRISRTSNPATAGQRADGNGKPCPLGSMPSQMSTCSAHAPLTRSSSLPFSVALLRSEKGGPGSSYQKDHVAVARRGSSGQIIPTAFAVKSVDQHVSTHRPLVRQAAVDCNPATEGLFMNSSVEEACGSSLSSDGDSLDICGEQSNPKCRRKKAQKFAYNKWYMYGGGTFKKLYGAEKDQNSLKARRSLMNKEAEGAQGTQRRTSATPAGSGAAGGLPSGPPVSLPPISSAELSRKASQLQPPCTSLKSPVSKHTSLPTQQPSSAAPQDSHSEPDRTEADKHPDCEGHIPSDRKKQKTDDKTCPSQASVDPNTQTTSQPFLLVPAGGPQTHSQENHISFIDLKSKPSPIQLQGAVSPACIVNANGPSDKLPAISIRTTAKTSFLPKYQLKLPNATEPVSDPSPQPLNQPMATVSQDFTTGLPSSHSNQTAIKTSASSGAKCTAHFISQGHMHSFKRTDSFSQSLSPLLASSQCQAEASTLATLSPSVTPTALTASVDDQHTTLCPTASVIATTPHLPVRSIPPAEENSPPADASSGSSHHLPPPAPQATVTQGQLTRVAAGLNATPSPVTPHDSTPPAAQNVFHVRTADLHICLQIISDEQLALIEPQIERQESPMGAGRSQGKSLEAPDPEVIRNKVQSSATEESVEKGAGCETAAHQKGSDRGESSSCNTEGIKPPLPVNLHQAEKNKLTGQHRDGCQVTASRSKPSGSSFHSHDQDYKNLLPETTWKTDEAMSGFILLKGMKSKEKRTPKEDSVVPLGSSALGSVLPEGGFSREDCKTLPGQQSGDQRIATPSTSVLSSSGGGRLQEGTQQKPSHQRPPCSVSKVRMKRQASVSEAWPAQQDLTVQRSMVDCTRSLTATTVTAPVCCSDQCLCGAVDVDRDRHCDSSTPSQDITLNQSQDKINLHQKVNPVSGHTQLEQPEDVPGDLMTNHSSTAGDHRMTRGLIHRTACRGRQDPGDDKRQHTEGQERSGGLENSKDVVTRTSETHHGTEQSGGSSAFLIPREMKLDEGEQVTEADPWRNSVTFQQHLSVRRCDPSTHRLHTSRNSRAPPEDQGPPQQTETGPDHHSPASAHHQHRHAFTHQHHPPLKTIRPPTHTYAHRPITHTNTQSNRSSDDCIHSCPAVVTMAASKATTCSPLPRSPPVDRVVRESEEGAGLCSPRMLLSQDHTLVHSGYRSPCSAALGADAALLATGASRGAHPGGGATGATPIAKEEPDDTSSSDDEGKLIIEL